MMFKEEYGDLFELDTDEWHFAHCVSRDLKMGAGIAVPMKKKFQLDNLSAEEFPVGTALLHNKVFNLITKERHWHKPTYTSLTNSLLHMRSQVLASKINKVAMPKIGCGIDGLDWGSVSEIIIEVFESSNIEIKVRIWP